MRTLTTMVLPHASAGATFQVHMSSGKFQGTIAPITPNGSWSVYLHGFVTSWDGVGRASCVLGCRQSACRALECASGSDLQVRSAPKVGPIEWDGQAGELVSPARVIPGQHEAYNM